MMGSIILNVSVSMVVWKVNISRIPTIVKMILIVWSIIIAVVMNVKVRPVVQHHSVR